MKRFFKFLTLILIISIIIASPSLFTVSAAQTSSNTFFMSCGTPSTGSGTGYLEVLLKDKSTGNLSVRTFMWSLWDTIYSADGYYFVTETECSPDILISSSATGEDKILFYCPNPSDGLVLNIYSLNNTGGYIGSTVGYDCWSTFFPFTTSTEIISFHIYGNYELSRVDGNLPMTEFYVLYSGDGAIYNAISSGQQNQTNQILQGQQQQTDRVLNAGENVNQPDFDSTNGSVNDTTNTMQSIEGQYQIDSTSTQAALNEGISFMQGSDMQLASIQVKNWIERFTSENKIITCFLISSMVLGLCFWVIGRKAF